MGNILNLAAGSCYDRDLHFYLTAPVFMMRIFYLPLIVLLLVSQIAAAQAKAPGGKAAAAAEVPKAPAKEPRVLLTKEELGAGWISLFDGQTLFGWKAHSDADWRVDGG